MKKALIMLFLLALLLSACGSAAKEQKIAEYGFKITVPGKIQLNQNDKNSATNFVVFTSVGSLSILKVGKWTQEYDYAEVLAARAEECGTTLRKLENGGYFYVESRDNIVASIYAIKVGDRWWKVTARDLVSQYDEEALISALMTITFPDT